MTLDYFYGQAGKLFSFYRIPKALFQEQRFQNLSTDAKTLYGILLDRMSLSVKNEWFDKQGRVFIIFTIEDVKRALCCADNKATKLLRELENFGLIERKRRGLGKPSLVYVKNFSSDLSNERVQNRENHESGSPKNACQDPPKSRCNKNKKSKTERNNTNPILSDELEKMKNRKLLEEYFSRSLEIELLLRLYPDDEDTIYQIVDLLVDTCDSKRKLIRIAGDDKPAEVVLSRLKKLNTQLFNLLCDKADDVYGGKLPIHVRCLIDECANIGQIPNLEKLVATIRSREISACLVLQARSQLKAIYKDNADTIVGNMDSQIFLGGSEPTTLKDLSEMLGKETIDAFNTSDTRGNSPSYGTTFQKMGHELLSRDELAVLDGGKCILQLRGVRPFLSDKYDLTQHPNYKLTSDYDPKNTFDIEKYLNRKEKIQPGDEFIVVDADSLPSA